MSVTPAAPRNIQWASGRAILIHLALITALPMCAIAARWQVDRALSGNALSWVYVFEWPAFGLLSVWLWWVLLTSAGHPPAERIPADTADHVGRRPERSVRRSELLACRSAPARWDRREESEQLRAYNTYLHQLAAEPDRARKIRRPRVGGS